MTLNNNTTFASMLQHHGSSKTSTLSGSFTDINKSAIKAFAFSLPLEARKARLTQTHGFCFIDPAGQMGKLSSFHWHFNPDGSKLLVGSRGEMLDHCAPASVLDDPFRPCHFLSLASQEMVELMDLPHFPITGRDPMQVEPPEGTPPNRDICWPIPTESEFPVFSVFPTIFPLLEGAVLPDAVDLTLPLPTTWPDDTPLEFIAWLRAFKYIWDHNSAKSLHSHAQMFCDSFPVEASFDKYHFVTDPGTTVTLLLDFGSVEYEAVRKTFQQAREMAYLRVSNSAPVPVTPNQGGNQVAGFPGGNDNSHAVGTAIARSMRDIMQESKLTGAERERKGSQTDAIAQWRLLFASGNEDNTSVEPGVLSPVFSELLQRTSKSYMVEGYRKEYSDFLTNRRLKHPYNFVYRQATHIEETFTHVFMAALQSFRWMNRGWIDAGASIKTELCVAHFFPNPVKSAAFTDYVDAGRRLLHQESMGEDKSKTDAKQSELFYRGRIDTLSDLISTICNLLVTFDFMIDDMESKPPFFLQPIHALLDAIQSDAGKAWIEKHSSVDHLYVALVAEVQHMLLPFISLASNSSLRRALKADQPLSIRHFLDAKSCSKPPMVRLYDAFTTGTLGSFTERTTLAFLVSSDSSSSKKHVSSGGSTPDSSPSKKPKKDSANSRNANAPPDSNGVIPGMLCWTKQGNPPFPVLKLNHPQTTSLTRICGYFLFKGRSCGNGISCRNVHIGKVLHLPTAKRSEFLQYVNSTDGVQFDTGRSPSTNNQGS
jgi:hypothetical protein